MLLSCVLQATAQGGAVGEDQPDVEDILVDTANVRGSQAGLAPV